LSGFGAFLQKIQKNKENRKGNQRENKKRAAGKLLAQP
jgi:hypothetical protein